MRPGVRSFWWLIGLTLPFAFLQPAAGSVSLWATSATAPTTGADADVCVVLGSGGAPVAGTQNDLRWDGTCATLASAADCHVNPAIGESLFGAVAGSADFTYRALVLSFADVEPIADGQLYCCTFTAEATPGSCCPIRVVNTAASDPFGRPLVAVGNTAQLCVAADSGALATTPTPPTPTLHGDPVQPADGGGCQIAPSASGRFELVGIAFLLALRRRRRPIA